MYEVYLYSYICILSAYHSFGMRNIMLMLLGFARDFALLNLGIAAKHDFSLTEFKKNMYRKGQLPP